MKHLKVDLYSGMVISLSQDEFNEYMVGLELVVGEYDSWVGEEYILIKVFG